MQENFTNELIENPSFIAWVRSDFEINNDEWSHFIDKYPEQHELINRAIRQVRSLAGESYQYESKDLLFSKIEKRIAGNSMHHRPESKVFNIFKKIAIAASFTAVVGMLVFFAGNKSFTTNVGEQLVVTLPDGSSALLNTSSSISYNSLFWNWKRSVSMDGEVYFNVKKGKKFNVITDQGRVGVLGTSFNVNVFSDEFQVQCFTGKVAVFGKYTEKKVVLTPPQGVRLLKNQEITLEDIRPGQDVPGWKNGREYFEDVPLVKVTATIQKYFKEKIVLDPDINALRLRGSIPVHDLDSALQNITWPLGLKYVKEGENVKITR